MKHGHRVEHLFRSLGGTVLVVNHLTREALIVNAAGDALLLVPSSFSWVARRRAIGAAVTDVLLLRSTPDRLVAGLLALMERRPVGVREEE